MCAVCGFKELIEKIDDMLDDCEDAYKFAQDSLEGIREWVDDHSHCTISQRIAVANIEKNLPNY